MYKNVKIKRLIYLNIVVQKPTILVNAITARKASLALFIF